MWQARYRSIGGRQIRTRATAPGPAAASHSPYGSVLPRRVCPGVLPHVSPTSALSCSGRHVYAGWKGSLPEPVCRERLASCLRDALAPSGALVAKMLPGIFSDGAPQDIQDEQATIMSEFHPVGFRLMSISSAETDTRDLLPRIQVPTLLLWGDRDRRSPVHVAEQLRAAIPAPSLRSSRRLDTSVTWSNRKSSMHTFVASV